MFKLMLKQWGQPVREGSYKMKTIGQVDPELRARIDHLRDIREDLLNRHGWDRAEEVYMALTAEIQKETDKI